MLTPWSNVMLGWVFKTNDLPITWGAAHGRPIVLSLSSSNGLKLSRLR